jgi:thiol-disulfide isomerase/thioredoxin
MKKFAPIVIALLLLTGCSNGGVPHAEESFISGDGAVTFIKKSDRIKAPKISGMTLLGTQYKFEGKKIAVVNVWASWCSPCRAEAPTLEEFAKKNPNIQFVGILTRDNPTSAQSFVERFGLTYPTLIDDAVIASFRGSLPANAIPTTIVIDTNGRVAARISGQVTVATMRDVLEKVSGSAVNV